MICRVCQVEKPEIAFYLRKETGRRRTDCRSCHAAKGKEWARNNPEKRRAIGLKYARANPEKASAWKRCNPVAAKQWDRDHPKEVRAMKAKWSKKNPDKVLANVQRRNAKKMMATPSWANHKAINEIYAAANKLGMEVDHIVPLRSAIVCGLHVEANLAIIPRWSNRKKSNKYWPDMP